MRELYTNIQLNYYWYPHGKLGLYGDRDHFFSPPTSQNFSEEQTQNEGRLVDGLETENCFFTTPGLTGGRLFLLFPGLDVDRLQQGRPSFSCSATYCTSPTSTTSEMRTIVRGALSPTADEATVSALNQRSHVFFTAFLFDMIFSRQDFKSAFTGPASTSIAPQGSNLALFRTASAAVTAVFSLLIPVSDKKTSLCEQGITHKVLHTRHCPLHFLMVDCNPIQRYSKDEMQLRRTPHH